MESSKVNLWEVLCPRKHLQLNSGEKVGPSIRYSALTRISLTKLVMNQFLLYYSSLNRLRHPESPGGSRSRRDIISKQEVCKATATPAAEHCRHLPPWTEDTASGCHEELPAVLSSSSHWLESQCLGCSACLSDTESCAHALATKEREDGNLPPTRSSPNEGFPKEKKEIR